MTQAVADRARQALVAALELPKGARVEYGLGKGGMLPERAFPWTPSRQCDCSGFTSWCAHSSRMRREIEGGWIETTAVVADAKGPHKLFHEVPLADAQPGDFFVYGDHRVAAPTPDNPHATRVRQGHIAVVSAIDANHPAQRIAKIIHCSTGNFTRTGCAIAETSADFFYEQRGAIVARWSWQ